MKFTEYLTIISAALSAILAAVSIWKIGNGVIKRLVIIQNRLSSLKALMISIQLRTNDLENFGSVNHEAHLRDYSVTMEKALIDEYEHGDTGF